MDWLILFFAWVVYSAGSWPSPAHAVEGSDRHMAGSNCAASLVQLADISDSIKMNRRNWMRLVGVAVIGTPVLTTARDTVDGTTRPAHTDLTDSQIGHLVAQFNAHIRSENPRSGYLLDEVTVAKSIADQLSEIPEPHRSNFMALLENSLEKDAELDFFSGDAGGNREDYFMVRLSITDFMGQRYSLGYSLRIGIDIH